MRSEDIVLRIIQKKPNITPTRLAKILYLIDLSFVQLTGKRKTQFPYLWHWHGPYCREIDDSLWELLDEGKISRSTFKPSEDIECTLHESLTDESPQLSETEESVVKYIIKKYANLPFKELLDFVYATPPMQDAQKKQKRFVRLNLKSQTGLPKIIPNKETARMILNSELKDKKHKSIDFEKTWQKIEDRCIESKTA
jgi:hypothetical protein